MKWNSLVCDFDGTIATDGIVNLATCKAIQRIQLTGFKTILITGREFSALKALNFSLQLFDVIVAENGALLYDVFCDKVQILGSPPPNRFISELRRRGVEPLSIGVSIVATLEHHEVTVLTLIKEMGLDLQVILNKGAVMIMPLGINKASGLQAAFDFLKLSPHEAVGVGDAENDQAFLDKCGFPVAVANALPAVKEKAIWVTNHEAGAGVVELIDALIQGEFDHLNIKVSPR